jgi:hypothetical protein
MFTNLSGPLIVSGNTDQIPQGGSFGTQPESDGSTSPHGISMFWHGAAQQDSRVVLPKDLAGERNGVIPATLILQSCAAIDGIPAVASTTNIVAAALPTSATSMTIVSTAATGIAPAVPYTNVTNPSTISTSGVTLDYGFAWMTTTSASSTATVSNPLLFPLGMPLVVMGAAGTNTPLLTVSQGSASSTTITMTDTASVSGTFPVGTGNTWQPQQSINQKPTFHLPYVADGPALVLDSRQAIGRCLSVTGTSLTSGGSVTIVGATVMGESISQVVTLASGTNTVYTTKAFKHVNSVTPGFTDASHNISVGTADSFGFVMRTDEYELCDVWFAGTAATSTSGFTAADTTNPATTTTGDTRGTMQFGTIGNLGTLGSGTVATNGTLSGTAMAGRKVVLITGQTLQQRIYDQPNAPQWAWGVTPV